MFCPKRNQVNFEWTFQSLTEMHWAIPILLGVPPSVDIFNAFVYEQLIQPTSYDCPYFSVTWSSTWDVTCSLWCRNMVAPIITIIQGLVFDYCVKNIGAIISQRRMLLPRKYKFTNTASHLGTQASSRQQVSYCIKYAYHAFSLQLGSWLVWLWGNCY